MSAIVSASHSVGSQLQAQSMLEACPGQACAGPAIASDRMIRKAAMMLVFVMGRSKPFHRMDRAKRAIFRAAT